MSSIASPDQLKFYLYKVVEIKILNGEQVMDIFPHSVTDITITHDFENSIYPIFRLQMVLTADQYYTIMQNKNTVKFKLRIQKFYTEPSGEKPSLMRDWINDTFTLIMDDQVENVAGSNLDTKWSKYSSEAEKLNCGEEYYFYRDEVATAMKNIVNAVLTGENLTNAINYTCTVAGITNMLVSPLENQQTYPQLILPPLTVHKELQHLDSQYGFYKSGAVIYFGLKNSYILNFKGGCTAYATGESQQTNFLFLSPDQNESLESGMIMKNDGHYNIHWKVSDVQVNNQSITNDVVRGSNVTVVDPTTTSITKTSTSAVTKGSANSSIVLNQTENNWMSQTITAQNNADGTVITGSVSNVDLDALTPNKKFTLIFEDSALAMKYRGTYMLMQEEIKLISNGGVDFSVTVGLTLKRVSDKGSETGSSM